MEEIKKYFTSKFEKTGIALTVSQLLAYAKDRKLVGVNRKNVSKFVSSYKHVAQFTPVKKVKTYQTVGVPRIGLFHIDYGEFHKNWAHFNQGCTGFMLAVENFTQRLFVIPCQGKGTEQWFKAVEAFVAKTQNVRIIYSDRDSVATSQSFRDKIVQKYNIKWYFLKKGNKAYLAECYIGFVKKKLSQALQMKGGQNWTQFVPSLMKEYNTQKIEGTSYRRQAVGPENFLHFLSQRLKTDDPELTFNQFKAGPFISKIWNSKVFQFKVGQKVLLARRANWKDAEEKSGVFTKASTVGGFGKKVYTISARQLRGTKKSVPTFVAVYALEQFGPSLHFYAEDLKAVDDI